MPNKKWGTPGAGAGVQQYIGYRVEHILEGNQLDLFMVENSDLCLPMDDAGWFEKQVIDPTRKAELPWEYIGRAYPFRDSHEDEFYSILEWVNLAKESVFMGHEVMGLKHLKKMKKEADVDAALLSMKITLMTWKYLNDPAVKRVLKAQADRVGDRMEVADDWFARSSASNWAKRDLRGKWLRFIKSNTDAVVPRLKVHLDEWIAKVEKIQAMREAIDGLTDFTSPF